jgi:hypothetical protein
MTLQSMRSRETARLTRMAGLLLAVIAAPSLPVRASDADIVLKPAGAMNLQGLSVGLFTADATLTTPVEKLMPLQAEPVSALSVSLNNNPGLCPDQTIARIVELPNQETGSATADGPECVFGVQLSIESGPKKYEIATECGDWVDNTATCWGYGQTGEFRLVRDAATAPSKFRLVFPAPTANVPPIKPPAKSSEEADAASSADPARQKHGLFLDTLLDDKKESKGDLWLVWTSTTVDVTFTR